MNNQKRKKLNKSNPMARTLKSFVLYYPALRNGKTVTSMRFKHDGLKKHNDKRKQGKACLDK